MTTSELFDIYDSENQPLNITKERTLVHRDGNWHRTSQVWVINRKKEILCNLRSAQKDLFPCCWDLSIGGHVSAGDSYEITAQREMKEELGIAVDLNELKFLSDEKVEGMEEKTGLIDREHARLFLYYTEQEVSDFEIQIEEIDKIEFFPIDKLLDVLENERSNDIKIVPIKYFMGKILKRLRQLELKSLSESEQKI